jgi:pyridoxamine 5'-phosphate oxidase
VQKSAISEFKKWFKKAQKNNLITADHMILATVGENKRPSARTLLLKSVDEKGFRFFTNYNSRKSHEIGGNTFGALVFNWFNISLQVRVEGKISKLTHQESMAYFKTRPRASQLGAWASPQSKVIPDRQFLISKVKFFEKKFKGVDVPCPPYWGGFILKPNFVDFMFLQKNRLHDRFTYRKKGVRWVVARVAP